MARKASRTGKSKAAKAPKPKAAKKPQRKAPAKPVRKAPKAKPAKAAAKVAPRASPAPKGVKVARPKVHAPAPLAVKGDEFVVQLDQGAAPKPIDAATGRVLPAPAPKAAAQGMTYAQTGVDIHKEDKAVEALAAMVSFHRTGFGAPMGKIGHFAGLVDFGAEDALVLCTDGVGSKVEVANALRKWDTVGIDCVAMNVNDALCVGAEPLAFVDYLAVQDPDPELTKQVGIGLNEGARQSNCSLIGGETASLPGIIKGFDLAGTCLAHVKKANIVDGSRIQPGDALIGLASTGIHSNGYSLARRAFESASHAYTAPWPWPEDKAHKGQRVGDVLLEPTRIYVREVLSLLRSGIPVHGLSHITGSGLRKLRRINQGVRYDVTDPLPVHAVFTRIQEMGQVADAEMYKTFNMGMGFVVVVPAAQAKKAVAHLKGLVDYEVKVVGKVAAGNGVHHPIGGVH
ncbi:MAG: phosphoribosylformylglycinamidine cyclo-ligase [Thermoplasmata archaeon]|nr:phosphoribosylformylglycinamidine cyclo-ligase [Thermoplasmata archaeon]